MADSYTSSRNGDVLSNGGVNGSSPLLPTAHAAGLSNVIRKKLMGYVGFANLPNQVHRKSVRKGFQFTAMVVGTWPLRLPQLATCISTNVTLQASQVWESRH
jgi:septin 7